MNDISTFENIALPVLGILILLALGVAVFLEPKKDYSRKTYLRMLAVCIVILLSECLQYSDFAKNPSFLRITMFVFYLALTVICYFWTLYAYYWFHDRPSSRKTAALFALGPACEILLLLVNLFTGIFYSVDTSGTYERGVLFILYIAFSYFYLLAVILITAAASMRENHLERRANFIMFLFCFLFPILGPVMQYGFPDFSLMGITEAMALLIVYVCIQQRTTAQFAVERARSQDEYAAYEESLEQLLTASSDALYVLRFNITQDILIGGHGNMGAFVPNSSEKDMDELRMDFASTILNQNEAERFLRIFERQNLIRCFEKNEMQLSMEYHRRVDSGEMHLLKIFFNMLQNPRSGDIEAILYSIDIDRQDKEEKVISAVTNREYDYIALISSETRKIHYQYAAQSSDASVRFEMGDYDDIVSRMVPDMRDPSEPGSEFNKISFQAVHDALEHDDEYSYIFEYLSLSGDIRQKKASYRYLDEQKTEILFFRIDITEETQAERARAATLQKALKEIKNADALKSEFLSNVSHDMRTPLNAILGYANLAQQSAEAAVIMEYLNKISQAGNLMLDLVNDTLDLSKIATGKITLKPSPNRGEDIIGKIVSTITPAANSKKIYFNLDDSRASRVPILVDAVRLQEIGINLLSNAIKFTPEHGRVDFIIECMYMDDDSVHEKITVRDTGRGMSPEFIPKMFEPFTQERQTSDTVGSGLGLSIVKKLVEMLDGQINVKSYEGIGTEFTLLFDFERTHDNVEQDETKAKHSTCLNDRNILLVEDNAMNAEIARAVLTAAGANVTHAENGQIACRVFSESEYGFFNAILMDIRMPVMTGYEAAEAIRKSDRLDAAEIPIIAMSADAFDEDVSESLRAGMNDHIAKPFQPEKLYQVLEENIHNQLHKPTPHIASQHPEQVLK